MIAVLRDSVLALVIFGLVQLAVIARILLRKHRQPASRIAWVVVVAALPLFGTLAYLFLGEVSIGRKRSERMREVLTRLRALPPASNTIGVEPLADCMPLAYRHLFELGATACGSFSVTSAWALAERAPNIAAPATGTMQMN